MSTGFERLLDPMNELDNLNEFYIKQPFRKKEFLAQFCCGWEVKNKYQVGYTKDNQYKTMFHFVEDSDCLLRQCCGSHRPLILKALQDPKDDSTLLFTIDKPFRCGCFCCSGRDGCCGRDFMYIRDKNGQLMGAIETTNDCCFVSCYWKFTVFDSNFNEICTFDRHMCKNVCLCECCVDSIDFDIKINGNDTGKMVSKTFTGTLTEIFTKNDNFRVQIPAELEQSRLNKLLLISTSMLLDFKFFEQEAQS